MHVECRHSDGHSEAVPSPSPEPSQLLPASLPFLPLSVFCSKATQGCAGEDSPWLQALGLSTGVSGLTPEKGLVTKEVL